MFGKIVLLCFRVVRKHSISPRYYSKESSKRLFDLLAKMPKPNSARIAEAQKQRQQISSKGKKYSSSTVYLQVLGSGANGAPNTLYLFSDQKRYLFNCGECTQRLAHEHKVRLTKLDHIFITSKTWRNIGGLPGLSLTLQDVGVPNITLHGPEGLDELYYATKRFVVMKDMNVITANCSPMQDFEDEVMKVRYVLIGPKDKINLTTPVKKQKLENAPDKDFQEYVNDNTDYYDKKKSPNDKTMDPNKIVNARDRAALKTKQAEKEMITKKKMDTIFDTSINKEGTVAYICTLRNRLGTLDLAKCVEKGVKPGPLLGQLKNGYDVVLPDGSFVSSKDVKTPDEPGPVFIVLEVLDFYHLVEKEFEAHFDDGTNPPENIPTVIVHFTPPHIFNDTKYRMFISRFGPRTRHLVLNSQNTCLGSEAVHRTQYRLHLLDTDIFPMLKDKSIPPVWNQQPLQPKFDSPVKLKCLEDLKNKIAIAQFQNIITARSNGEQASPDDKDMAGNSKLHIVGAKSLMIQHLRPNKSLDRSAEPKLHIQDYLQETMDIDGFSESLEAFRNIVDEMRYTNSLTQEDFPKVVFLGTGSCIPSKTRNTSAIVIQINESHSMLLDCGEGTYGQLVRFYGPNRVNAFLRTLKAVYVSHLHADHHIGLIGVLQARRRAFDEIYSHDPVVPLYLLAPGQIYTWLSTYDQHFEKIKNNFVLVPNQHLMPQSSNRSTELTPAMMASIGIENLVTCHVCHCPNAFGVAVQVDANHKLTYSGDTIPCDDLVAIGENSTLLIHEATMEDELAEEARIKMHSTTSQAIEIGRRMNAKYTVLTHFSQRYARLPRLNSQILNDNTTVGIAFDNMQITMNDLRLLPFMYAPLQMLFSEHCVEMEMRAAQRSQKKNKLLTAASQNLPNSQRAFSTGTPSSSMSSNSKNLSGIKSPSLLKTSNFKASPMRGYIETHSSCLRRISYAKTRKSPNSKSPSKALSPFNKVPFQLYIETHSSRLRQQKKGMQVYGMDRKESRNRSPPTRKISQSSYKNCPRISLSMEPMRSQEKINPHLKSRVPELENKSAKINLVRSASEYLYVDQEEKVEESTKLPEIQEHTQIESSQVPPPSPEELSSLNINPSYEKEKWRHNRNLSPNKLRQSCPTVHENETWNYSRELSLKKTRQPTATPKSAPAKMTLNRPPVKAPVVSKRPRPPERPPWVTDKLAPVKSVRKTRFTRSHTAVVERSEAPSEVSSKESLRTRVLSMSGLNIPSRQKSFQPELEDINSSYMLLLDTPSQRGNKNKKQTIKDERIRLEKPEPFDEDKRKKLLLESKKKFASKTFKNELKFERIEGLNWISWK